jgi:hypothetical protein
MQSDIVDARLKNIIRAKNSFELHAPKTTNLKPKAGALN